MKANHVFELELYQESFRLQQEIFGCSKLWPREETYSLIDQVRRSSRSIGANLCEAWSKRRYPAHFLSKLTDVDGELTETRHWLKTAHACSYVESPAEHRLNELADTVGRLLGGTIQKYDLFCRER